MKSLNHCGLVLAGLVACAAAPTPVQAQDTAAAIEQLQKQIQSLQEEVQRLKAATFASPEVNEQAAEAASKGLFKAKGLTVGFYGESKYRFPESGANSFDAHRYVLSPHYQINDWLVFNSELEMEHGGVDESTGRGSRFNGELELEQFYVDILINEHFNVRSLGIDLIPAGRVNLYHEPTTFYSTERPELYREIIPSTWMEPGMGIFGKITDTLDYRLQVSTGLEDFSSSASGAGVTAASGMRNARPRMRAADENRLAYSGRLHFNGIRGLDASTSFYHASMEGFEQRDTTATLWDIEAIYRVPNTGLELRGDFAHWWISAPNNLIANNNASLTDDIGQRMYGWHVEAAYHFWPEAWREGKGQEMNLVPFVRFSQIVTQSDLPSGSSRLKNGTANRDFVTAGLAYFLNPNFVVKADWRLNLDDSEDTRRNAAAQDYAQVGVGMFF